MRKVNILLFTALSIALVGCKRSDKSATDKNPTDSKTTSGQTSEAFDDGLNWPESVLNDIEEILGEYTLPFYKTTKYTSEILTAEDGITKCVSVDCLNVNEKTAISSYSKILENNDFIASTSAENYYFKDVSKIETQFVQFSLVTIDSKTALNIQSLVRQTRTEEWPSPILNSLFSTQISEVEAETYEYSWSFKSVDNKNFADMPAMSIYCNGISSNAIGEYKAQLIKDGFETSKVSDIDYAVSQKKNVEILMYNYTNDVLYLSISKHQQEWPSLYLELDYKLELPIFSCENVKYQTQYQNDQKAYVIFCDNATKDEYIAYCQSLIDSYNFLRFEDTSIDTQGYCLYQGSDTNPTHQLQIVYSSGSNTQMPSMAVAIFV